MNEKLTDEMRKVLTGYLGECRHEGVRVPPSNVQICKNCGRYDLSNRTLDTWQDYGDLKNKLVEKGLWEKFENWSYIQFDGDPLAKKSTDMCNPAAFTSWLISPARIPLIAEFLERVKA